MSMKERWTSSSRWLTQMMMVSLTGKLSFYGRYQEIKTIGGLVEIMVVSQVMRQHLHLLGILVDYLMKVEPDIQDKACNVCMDFKRVCKRTFLVLLLFFVMLIMLQSKKNIKLIGAIEND